MWLLTERPNRIYTDTTLQHNKACHSWGRRVAHPLHLISVRIHSPPAHPIGDTHSCIICRGIWNTLDLGFQLQHETRCLLTQWHVIQRWRGRFVLLHIHPSNS
jgi:hypothetical protein